jgi:hypothetical protein
MDAGQTRRPKMTRLMHAVAMLAMGALVTAAALAQAPEK